MWPTQTYPSQDQIAVRPACLAQVDCAPRRWDFSSKQLLDLAVVVSLAPLWLPLVYALALLVRWGSPGKALYSHQRLGLGGVPFRCWKLRTMVHNADDVLQQYLEENPAQRAEWDRNRKLKNDPRVTPIGRLLRLTSLDELPQLFNVLRGEMSLVGPRPIVSAEVNKYVAVWQLYTTVKPGITGLWQVNGRNNTTYQQRLDYDAYYVRHQSLWFDLCILMRTIKVVLLCEGAY